MENEAQFADVILPVCTALERDDIAEWANSGGYIQHGQTQLNHRMIMMLHKCIEPLGASDGVGSARCWCENGMASSSGS